MIKTSIIIPVYNTSAYLKECFNSIFNQTQKEIEIIAINDGSTDNSLSILQQIKKDHPEMIIFTQDNKGLGSARNKGLELARGEFIYFIDSDDCLVDTALETCYQYAKNNNLDVVMFDAETFGNIQHNTNRYNRSKIILDQKVVLSGEDFANKYWLKFFVSSVCLIYTSAQFLRQYNLKFLPRIYYEDNEFHCKMLPLAKRIMYIPHILYKRRYRGLSITTDTFDLRHAKDYLTMIQAVHRNEYSNKLNPVIHKLQLNFLNSLYIKSSKGNLLKDISFFQELYNTTLSICGGKIENIKLFSDIDLLSQITDGTVQDIVPEEVKKKIENRKMQLTKEIFSKISMEIEEDYIGIYGTGKNTERFLYTYQNYVDKIKATLIFIETNVISKEKQYKGFDVFNVNDIENIPLKYIIIASSKFESEIYQIIKEKYGNKFKIIRLRSDLQF